MRLSQSKVESAQRLLISNLNMFHKKVIHILTDREFVASILERFNFKEKTLETQFKEMSLKLKDAQASKQILYQIQNSINIALNLLEAV